MKIADEMYENNLRKMTERIWYNGDWNEYI